MPTNMRNTLRPILAAAALLVLAGCAAHGGQGPYAQSAYGQQMDWQCIGGTVVGGVAGAAIGNQIGGGRGRTLMTGVGAAGGALAGSELACPGGSGLMR